MDNQLEKKLSALVLTSPLIKDKYNLGETLKEQIEKPLWTITEKKAKDTLIPDLITFWGERFIIFDAKYYNALLEKGQPPKGQPGIESVTKQYLYQLAYKDFIADHGFTDVRNCFLIPTEGEDVIRKGEAKLSMLGSLGLQDIAVRLIPAKRAYELFLTGSKMDIEKLGLWE